ncbi:hypothetical protein [Aeromonas sp. NJAU223]|uniref:hypothetical protein n=1 Tax=Aeromonas sp. NJAU223 TaxID=3115650 RepID=UPI003DA800FA
MAVALTNESMKRLKAWLDRETWHTSHAIDEDYFYQFVGQYVTDHGYEFNEENMRQLIAQVAEIGERSGLREVAHERTALMREIIDFMKATGRR